MADSGSVAGVQKPQGRGNWRICESKTVHSSLLPPQATPHLLAGLRSRVLLRLLRVNLSPGNSGSQRGHGLMQGRDISPSHPLLQLTKGWRTWDWCVYILVFAFMLKLWLKLWICTFGDCALNEDVFVWLCVCVCVCCVQFICVSWFCGCVCSKLG